MSGGEDILSEFLSRRETENMYFPIEVKQLRISCFMYALTYVRINILVLYYATFLGGKCLKDKG